MSRLPCHKGVGKRSGPPGPSTHNNPIRVRSTNDNSSNPNRCRKNNGEVPYVSPDGGKTRYYADRYYLDAPTALLEYQLDNQGKGGASKNTSVEYCDLCGEIREAQQIRGTLSSSNTPQPTRPLFDRAKFINSLDLSAAIVGTYTIGNFEYLSDEFPMLFPRSDDMRRNGKHVPTLVLHGQKAFSLQRWSSSDRQKQRPEMKESGTAPDTNCDEPLGIRGGGGDCSSQSSTCPTNSNGVMPIRGGGGESSSQESTSQNNKATKNSSAVKKRPCFTYENQKLKLPKTPKRLRITKRTESNNNDDENDCRKNNNNTQEQLIKGKPNMEVIVIDSDSENETESKRSAKQSMNYRTSVKEELPSPKSSAICDKKVLSPAQISQQSQKSTPTKTDTSSSDYADSTIPSLQNGHLPIPDKAASIDSPAALPTKQAASILTHAVAESELMNNKKAVPIFTNAVPTPEPTTSPLHSSTPPKSAGTILTRVLGKPQTKVTMRPIVYKCCDHESSQESSMSADFASGVFQPQHEGSDSKSKKEESDNQPKMGWGGVKPASTFGGEVFFTQVLPRWCPPEAKKQRTTANGKMKETTKVKEKTTPNTENATATDYSYDEACEPDKNATIKEDEADLKTVRGVHHPKFFLLFERSGSLVVIISTSNLTPQNSTEGSWVQRFHLKDSTARPTFISGSSGGNTRGNIDFGMPSDFGAILTDFLKKQSEAAAGSAMMPDVFLRRYVHGLSSGLNGLSSHFRFDEAQVHLVSTVPGDYISGLPRKGHRDPTYKPRIAYGPQRVSYILSRLLNKGHQNSARDAKAAATGRVGGGQMDATMPWLPPLLVNAKEKLVIQPTSLGGNWTRDDLEVIVHSYLQPGWDIPTGQDHRTAMNGALDHMDIVWPSLDSFDTMRNRRRAILNKNPEAAAAITKKWASSKEKDERGEGHVFLSSVSFAKLDRSCISRMALFTPTPNVMPYKSTSIHIKSIGRLLQLNVSSSSKSAGPTKRKQMLSPGSKEYLSWFMLTSACLSRGAQGQPTPYRDPTSDSMSYSNFELGVLFCSRLVGDNKFDRLYVADPDCINGCQCGKGKRLYKPFSKSATAQSILESVRKVHLPIPYQLRPKPYQDDPDSDFMSHTPYMHDIPEGTGCVGNMKLTPLGQQIANDVQNG